jgi:hypothetical protein
VDDAEGVGGGDALARLEQEVDGVGDGEGAALLEHRGKVLAGEVPHHHERVGQEEIPAPADTQKTNGYTGTSVAPVGMVAGRSLELIVPGLALAVSITSGTASAQDGPEPLVVAGHAAPKERDPLDVDVHVSANVPGVVFGRARDFAARGPRRPTFYWDVGRCAAPCDITVSAIDGPYQAVGFLLVPSDAFGLSPQAKRIDIHIHAGYALPHLAGILLTIAGGTCTAIGAGAGLLEVSAPTAAGDGRLRTAGVFLAVGIPLLALGLPLWLTQRTRVDIVEHPLSDERTKTSLLLPFKPSGFGF